MSHPDKPLINISLNVTYYCNLRCDFCYLTPQQLGDKTRLPIDIIAARLDELMETYTIGHVDLYGGEVLLLPEDYLNDLKELLLSKGIDDIVIITNLTLLPDIVHDSDIELSVSYDFGAREQNERVLQNIYMLSKPFTILSLAGRGFLDTVSVDEYVMTMNSFPHLRGCEIKPYSSNQANQQSVSFKEYEDFVWAVVTHPDRTFHFENESQIKAAVEGSRNAFSDDHLYITPTGDYAVLEFDENDNEFFLIVDGIDGYLDWCSTEYDRVAVNEHCSTCHFNGNCLSEHLREVKTMDQSCNGFKGLLLKWVENET